MQLHANHTTEQFPEPTQWNLAAQPKVTVLSEQGEGGGEEMEGGLKEKKKKGATAPAAVSIHF